MDHWARAQPPSSAMLMVHTHLRGAGQGKPSSSTKQPRRGPRARGNPGLRFILAKKRLPERLWLLGQKIVSTAQWQALSPLSGKSVERTASPSQRRPARRPPWKSFWTLRSWGRRTPSWGSHGPVAWVKQEEAWQAICLQPASGSLSGELKSLELLSAKKDEAKFRTISTSSIKPWKVRHRYQHRH